MTLPNDGMTETAIHDWLIGYAWADDTAEAKEARVKCIMAQDDWRYVDALADKFAGAQFEPGPKAFADGVEFALSALYETHDGPHIDGCPSLEWERRARQDLAIPEPACEHPGVFATGPVPGTEYCSRCDRNIQRTEL